MLRCRSVPEIPVQPGRCVAVGHNWIHSPGRLLIVDAAQMNRPEVAVLDVLLRCPDIGCAAILEPALNDPFIFAGRLQHLLSLPTVVGRRLLDVHIFARLTSPDCGKGVPVIRSSRNDGINRTVVQGFAEILDDSRCLALSLDDGLSPGFGAWRVRIARVGKFAVTSIEEPSRQGMTAPATSHGGHDDLLIGGSCANRTRVGEYGNPRSEAKPSEFCLPQESAAMNRSHTHVLPESLVDVTLSYLHDLS